MVSLHSSRVKQQLLQVDERQCMYDWKDSDFIQKQSTKHGSVT